MGHEHVTLDELVSHGLIAHEDLEGVEVALEGVEHTPIYMQIISGVGGLFASLFFISFIVCLGMEASWGISAAGGAALLASALFMRRTQFSGTSPLAQALISARLTGVGLILVSLGAMSESPSLVALACIALCAILYPLDPDRLMRFIATCAAYIAGAALIALNVSPGAQDVPAYVVFAAASLSSALVLGRVGVSPALERTLEPLGYASACVALVCVSISMFDGSTVHPAVLRALLVLPMLILVARAWTRGDAQKEPLIWASGAVAFLALLTNTGLLAALLTMLLGASSHRRALIAIGTASLLPFLSHYYYWLDVSLLAKSVALMTTSAFFFALRAVIRARPWMRSTLDAAEAT